MDIIRRLLCDLFLMDIYNPDGNWSQADLEKLMQLQGGKMSWGEVRIFRSGFMPELKVYLREYDDAAKKQELNLSSTHTMLDYQKYLETALLHGRVFA